MIKAEAIHNPHKDICLSCYQRPATVELHLVGRSITNVSSFCGVCAIDAAAALERAVQQAQDATEAHNHKESQKDWLSRGD